MTIGTPLVHCWYSLGRPVTIGTPMVLSVFDDSYSVPFVKNSQKTVKTAKMTIGVPIVTSLPRLPTVYQLSTTVKNSQKTVKQQKMTIGVPIVTCLYTESAEYTKPRIRRYLAKPHTYIHILFAIKSV